VYCHGELSSKLNHENTKFSHQLPEIDLNKFTTFQIVDTDATLHAQLIDKFWVWMKNNYRVLKRIHVLGGEPFYQREFDDFLDFFDRNPHPQLEFNIVTNLSIDENKLKNYVEKFKQLVAQKKIRRLEITCSIDCWGPQQEYVRYGINLTQWEHNFNYLLDQSWLCININQVITPLTIKTMPELLIKLREWKKKKSVQQFFSGATPGPDYLKPTIFGGKMFEEDFKQILELMPKDTTQEQEAVKYMQGIWAEINSAEPNKQEIANLKFFLDEMDRRRNTNWKELFKWIA
jgi:organic radical activating enzyme